LNKAKEAFVVTVPYSDVDSLVKNGFLRFVLEPFIFSQVIYRKTAGIND